MPNVTFKGLELQYPTSNNVPNIPVLESMMSDDACSGTSAEPVACNDTIIGPELDPGHRMAHLKFIENI